MDILELGSGTICKKLVIEKIQKTCEAYLINDNSKEQEEFLIERITKLSKELED